jgi:hypothetical protein
MRILKAKDLRGLLEMLYLASCLAMMIYLASFLTCRLFFLSCLIFYHAFGSGDVSSVPGDGEYGVFSCSKLLS